MCAAVRPAPNHTHTVMASHKRDDDDNGSIACVITMRIRPLMMVMFIPLLLAGLPIAATSANATTTTVHTNIVATTLLATGSDLQVNCSLPDNLLAIYNSSNIRFRFAGDGGLPASRQERLVDGRTRALRVVGATRRMSGVWSCILLPNDRLLGALSITVADLPVRPNITGCVVYNWESMTCTWEPKQQDTGIPTNQTLYWTLLDNTWFRCPYPKGSECEWRFGPREKQNALKIGFPYHLVVGVESALGKVWSDIKTRHTKEIEHGWFICPNAKKSAGNMCMWLRDESQGKDTLKLGDMTYFVFVMAHSELGRARSNPGRYQIHHIVKPNPVKNLVVKDKGRYYVNITWEPPTKNKLIYYKVEYAEKDSSLWKDLNITAKEKSDLHMTVEDLLPYRTYIFRLSCIPVITTPTQRIAGFWSDEQNLTVTTDMSTPTAAPPMSTGSFRITDDQQRTDRRKVSIFWQSVPEGERNGLIERYRLRYRERHTERWQVKSVDASRNMLDIRIAKNRSYEVMIDAETSVGRNEMLANRLTPLYIESQSKMPSAPGKVIAISLEENIVYMNWSAIENSAGYTVYWCKGSMQFKTCDDELLWASVDRNTTCYNITTEHSQPKNYIFGVSAEKLADTSMNTDEKKDENRRKREVGEVVVSSGIKWSDCTHPIDKPVVAPQNVRFSDHQQPSSLTLQWTPPKCGESAYIEKYVISYQRVSEASEVPEDVQTVFADGNLDDFIVTGLTPSIRYRVTMQSYSPYKGLSSASATLEESTYGSGLPQAAIAGIVVGGIVLLFFIIFGCYQTVKTCSKKIDKNVNLKVELPPEVTGSFPQRRYDESQDADYLQNYNTLLPVDCDGKLYPPLTNGTQGRGCLTNGLSHHRASSYGVSTSTTKESICSNDTMMTLLQHPSTDSFDDDSVFYSEDSGGAGVPASKSVTSQLRLTTVPEETADSHRGSPTQPGPINRQVSQCSQRSWNTIPGYSRCGLPSEGSEYTDDMELQVGSYESRGCSSVSKPLCLQEGSEEKTAQCNTKVDHRLSGEKSNRENSPVASEITAENSPRTIAVDTNHQKSGAPGRTALPGECRVSGEYNYSVVKNDTVSNDSGCGPSDTSLCGGSSHYSNPNEDQTPLPTLHTEVPEPHSPTQATGTEHRWTSSNASKRDDVEGPCHMDLIISSMKSPVQNNNTGYVAVNI